MEVGGPTKRCSGRAVGGLQPREESVPASHWWAEPRWVWAGVGEREGGRRERVGALAPAALGSNRFGMT